MSSMYFVQGSLVDTSQGKTDILRGNGRFKWKVCSINFITYDYEILLDTWTEPERVFRGEILVIGNVVFS